MNKTITIPTPKIFSFEECLKLLDRGLNDCLYKLERDKVSRLIRISSGIVFIVISHYKNNIHVEISKPTISNEDIDNIKAYVVSWFDLERNIQPFYKLLNSHSLLNQFPQKYFGTRIIGIPDLYEAICWCIIGQQINLQFAHRVKRNLVEAYGEKKEINGIIYYAFPTPETILSIEKKTLAEMKFSRQKINYIYNISEIYRNNKSFKSHLLKLNTKEERIDKLTEIKGIGIWTANYVCMKSLGDLSCITYGDTGISKAIYQIFGTDKKPTNEQIDDIFSKFKGWESYLNIYLWRSLE